MYSRKHLAVLTATLFGTLLLPAVRVRGADAPPVKLALSFKPVQKDVEIETPDPDDYDKCQVQVERTARSSGWVVFGPAGQVLRRYVDSNGDNVVDQWRYYQNGLEVYRDIDANFNNKVDQSRWLNMAGSRWGLDNNEDGRIDAWKVLSAEEASREAVRAMAAGDEKALSALLVGAGDLKTLGLNSTLSEKILEAVSTPGQKMREAAAGSEILTSGTRWMRFDSLMPASIPADASRGSEDLTVHENAMAIVETGGKSGLVEIGEMVLVGDCWKLTQIPRPLEGDTIRVTVGGLLMQPALASTAGGAAPGDLSPTVRKLLEQLQELDKSSPSPTASSAALTSYNIRRADLLAQLAAAAQGDEEREQWTRQLVDGIAAGVQSGTFPQGIERLDEILADVRRGSPKSPLVAYVTYRRLLANYSVQMQQASNADRAEIQQRWLKDLERFATDHPNAEDAPDAMLQLAIAQEFSGELKLARQWYDNLAGDYADTPAGIRAAGAIRRLDLVGKNFNFRAAGLNGGTIDVASFRGKVLLVLFWSTWCKPCTEDLPSIRELYRLHHEAGFEILGVNLDTTADPVAGFLKEHGVGWPQIHEPGGLESRPAKEFGIISLPTMFLVDKSGTVVGRNISVDDLKKQVPELLK